MGKYRDWAGTKRAQRAHPLTQCELCGCRNKSKLQRHHNDLDQASDDISILCHACHSLIHQLSGTWGSTSRRGRTQCFRVNGERFCMVSRTDERD